MTYKKGESGNLKGRPKGTGNVYTSCIRDLQQKNEPHLLELFYKKAKEVAEQNDDLSGLHAIYKSTERHRGQIIPLVLSGSFAEQVAAIHAAMAEGKLTPSEFTTLMTGIEKEAKVFEVVELENKVNFLWEEREKQTTLDSEREVREMYGAPSVVGSTSND